MAEFLNEQSTLGPITNTIQEGPSTNDLLSGFSFLNSIVDGNTNIFRYGIFNNPGNEIEDPTVLGFTLEIDDQSPLFTEIEGFISKYKLFNSEIASREPVYNEFKNNIVQFFKSQESATSNVEKGIYIKSHYINTISGLDNLTKKFIDYGTDKISIQLYEDIKLHSNYLAYLYNNLIYSYDSGRELLPINLRRFNLHIKISEIRNITNIRALVSNNANDNIIAEALKKNLTSIVYTLHDCHFDFFKSKSFADSITQSGLDSNIPPFSTLDLDIYFKSVSRFIRTPLIPSSITMYDGNKTLGFTKNGIGTKSSDSKGDKININGQPYQPKLADNYIENNTTGIFLNSTKKSSIILKDNKQPIYNLKNEDNSALLQKQNEEQILKDQFNNQTFYDNNVDELEQSNLIDKIKSKAKDKSNLILMRSKNKIKGQIKELSNELLYDVRNKLGIKQIVPNNVYTSNMDPLTLQNAIDSAKSIIGIEGTKALNDLIGGL